nr:glycosyltransferase family 4 protein [Desulfocicer vacuolatum]
MPENYDSHINIRRRVLTDASFLILSLFFDKTVLVSKDIANLVKKRFFFGYNNTAVIHNGIRPATCCQKLCVNPFVIGSAGRLVPVKNYRLMLRIVELISCHRDKNIVFKLAGDGPEKGMLCELAEIHGLGKKIEFLGHLDNMEAFYKTIDLYLNTSLHEGIPMTILEAMSHGIPVIAPDVGGIREIIDDGRDGFVMEQRTAHDFAMKCLFFHKNEDEYHKMSRLAVRKIIKKFTAKKMASDYCRLYDDLHV